LKSPSVKRNLFKPDSLSKDSIDIEAVRSQTPGVLERVHLNNAGSGLMPQCVFSSMIEHIEHIELEGHIDGYEAADEKAHMLDALYDDVASLIDADRDEVAIMDNATIAWDHAFYAMKVKAGDRILTSQAEYAANYVAFLQRARKEALVIDVVPNDNNGGLDLAALEQMIDERVALIPITWIPTNGGLVNPAAQVGAIAKRFKIPYLLDACQALGQMPVDVRALGCRLFVCHWQKVLACTPQYWLFVCAQVTD
jgi:cysteine desulfurase/selenocysteine lyase